MPLFHIPDGAPPAPRALPCAPQTVTAAPAQPLSPAKAAAAPVADRDVDGGWGADTDALPRRAQAAPKQQDKQQQERRRDEPRGPLTTPQRPAKAAGAQPLTPAGAGARDADGKAAPSSATKSPNCARPTVASTVRAQETCRPAPSEATWHY